MSFGDGFKECANCAGKPGAPELCPTCLHNRALEAERDGWRRDCIAAVAREHRFERMIAKARKLMRGPGSKHPTLRSQKQFADVYRALDTRARR